MHRLLQARRAAVLAIGLFWAVQLQAQFVAFNDHAPGPNYTAPFTTTWDCLIAPTGGLLKNISSGADTPVTLNISRTTINPAGIPIANGGSSAAYPNVGTPAYVTFTNYVDFVGSPGAAVQISNVLMHYTFSGLDPAKRYNFKGSAVRGGSTGLGANYTNRWTKVAITGADDYDSWHTANVITSDTQASLAANEAVVNFGVNLTGDMVVWDQIAPGAVGTFEVTCEMYRGPLPAPFSSTANNPPYCYSITAIRLEEFLNVIDPVAISSGPDPASTNIVQDETASFHVEASGTRPRFHWYREDGQPIAHAIGVNSPTLTITNAQPSDGQPTTYRVAVTNAVSTNISAGAVLFVQPDLTPPAIVSTLGFLNGSNFLIGFSEPLDQAGSLANSAFHIGLTAGGGDLVVSSVIRTNGTNLFITTADARQTNLNYSLSMDGNAVFDLHGNGSAGMTAPLAVQVALLSFSNTPWKYNPNGEDLSLDWYLEPEYDDSGWSNGISVFDVVRPQPPGRPTVAGFPVATQLPLTNSIFSTTSVVIPTYYYRTHFNLPATPEHVISLKLRTLVDDFDDFFLNGQEAHRSSGYQAGYTTPFFGYAGGTAVTTASVLGPFDVATSLLTAGTNTAAAIVNQVNGTSSDSTFAYELIAVIDQFTEPPRLSVSIDSASGLVTITWTDNSAILYAADDINVPPAGWAAVSAPNETSYSTSAGSAAGQKFFTLRKP